MQRSAASRADGATAVAWERTDGLVVSAGAWLWCSAEAAASLPQPTADVSVWAACLGCGSGRPEEWTTSALAVVPGHHSPRYGRVDFPL